MAGATAVTAVALAAVAVIGDGYFEVFKHVWLASYLLVMTGVWLLAAGTTALLARRERHIDR